MRRAELLYAWVHCMEGWNPIRGEPKYRGGGTNCSKFFVKFHSLILSLILVSSGAIPRE